MMNARWRYEVVEDLAPVKDPQSGTVVLYRTTVVVVAGGESWRGERCSSLELVFDLGADKAKDMALQAIKRQFLRDIERRIFGD